MTTDPSSLANLQDISLPPPPTLWPPATGVWLLLVVLILFGLIVLHAWYIRRQNSAYRRAGLALLSQADSHYAMNRILKRVSLATFPREVVAPLYGREWDQFLDSTCSQSNFMNLREQMPDLPLETYRTCAATWIRHHKKRGSS